MPGDRDESDRTKAVFISTTELRCNVDLDPKKAVLVEYNDNPKTKVVVLPQVGADPEKDDYKDMPADKPDSIPFDTGYPAGKALKYAYIETACGDGVKADNEIGVDCGVAACGKQCEWDGAGTVAKGDPCDAKGDCKSDFCNQDKVCAAGIFSCHHVKQANKNAQSGYYMLAIDKNWRSFTGGIDTDGKLHEVYCDFYDGRAFTLFEMMCSQVNNAGTSPYPIASKWARHPTATAKIGRIFKANPNQCARYEVAFINSIFKHSEGYVMTRYNNNANEHHVTDVYGTPEDNKHILHTEHECSDKKEFNLATAYRAGTGGANAGMCFKGKF